MHIWHHRPLFLACTVFMVAVTAGFFLAFEVKLAMLLLIFVLALAVGGLGLLKKIASPRAGIFLLLQAIALLGMGSSVLYFDVRYASFTALDGQICTVEGTVIERRGSGAHIATYTFDMDAVNGNPISADALLTCYYTSDLTPGDRVTMRCEAVSLATAAGDYYEEYTLLSEGFLLGLDSYSETEYTITGADDSLRVRLANLSNSLSHSLSLSFEDSAQGFPSALLLGDRSDLAPSVRRNFSRAGAAHLLAISGLHMTLLFGTLEGVLRLCRLPPRFRAVLLGAAATGYLCLLGFPPSATRAVIMLGFTYLSVLCSVRADGLTSLGFAGALILLLSPHTVADVGFWLSFASTFGILCATSLGEKLTPLSKTGGRVKRFLLRMLIKPLSLLLTGVAAMTFTLYITALAIGELSILSPITTGILTPAVGFTLVASPVAWAFDGASFGSLIASGVETACDWMCDTAAYFAESDYVVQSLAHPAVLLLAGVMTLALLVMLGLKLKHRWMVFIPAIAGWSAIALVLSLSAISAQGSLSVTYIQPSTAAEAVVLTKGNKGIICDLSNGSRHALTTAARQATTNGATELTAVLLTHYHSRHIGALGNLMGWETVRELWLPTPVNREDYYLMLSCLSKAEAHGVRVILYDHGEPITVFGDVTLTLERTDMDRSEQPVHLMILETSEERLTLCGGSVFESSLSEKAKEAVAQSDHVIFAAHGPNLKAPYAVDLGAAEYAVFADDEVAAYLDIDSLPDAPPVMIIGQARWDWNLGDD